MNCREMALAIAAHMKDCKNCQYDSRNSEACKLENLISSVCNAEISNHSEIIEFLERVD